MSLLYHELDLDQVIDIEYNETPTAEIVPLNEVGATGSLASGELFYNPPANLSDSNTIYVSQTSGSDNNPGTQSQPVKTLSKAQTLCNAPKTNIMIMDSATYNESVVFQGYVTSLYAAKGKKPTIIPKVNQVTNFTNVVPETLNTTISRGFFAIPYINDTVLVITQKVETPCKTLYAKTITKTGNIDINKTLIFANQTNASPRYIAYNQTSKRLMILQDFNEIMSSDGKLWAKLFYEDLSGATGEVLLLDYSSCIIILHGLYALSNGNFVIVWSEYNGTYGTKRFMVISPTMQLVAQRTLTTQNGSADILCHEYDNYLYFYTYITGDTAVRIYKYTLNCDYVSTIIQSSTQYYAVGSAFKFIPCADRRYVISTHINNNILYIVKYDILTGDVITTYQLESATTSIVTHGHFKLQDDLNLIGYTKTDNSTIVLGYIIVDDDVVPMCNKIILKNGTETWSELCGAGFSDGSYLLSYIRAIEQNAYYRIYKYDSLALNATIPATIGGCVIQHNNKPSMRILLKIENDLNVQYCTFSGENTNSQVTAISGSGNLTANNTLFTTNKGCNVTGSITTNYCQYINSYADYALVATNAIIINHCDFVMCYGAAKAPTVNIKNSIIYRPAAKQFEATTYNYSYSLDTATPLPNEQNVIHSSPGYINDGIVNPALRDLNLRMRILGYLYDSDAAYIADDGYHAGSLLVTYGGVGFSYNRARFEKDRWGIKREIDVVGEVKLEKKDGSDATYKDALKEVITIKWRAMTLDDFEKLLDIVKNPKSRVRVYFNPISRPNEYMTYRIVYSKLPASVDDSIYLSSRYVKDVSLTLSRGLS